MLELSLFEFLKFRVFQFLINIKNVLRVKDIFYLFLLNTQSKSEIINQYPVKIDLMNLYRFYIIPSLF